MPAQGRSATRLMYRLCTRRDARPHNGHFAVTATDWTVKIIKSDESLTLSTLKSLGTIDEMRSPVRMALIPRWRTAHAVDLVLAVVPAQTGDAFEVLAFESETLIGAFDEAWQALERAGRSLSFEIPVFIPLDRIARKNVGHEIANLKDSAIWKVVFSAKDVEAATSSHDTEALIERFKREFAEMIGVEVAKIVVEVRIVS